MTTSDFFVLLVNVLWSASLFGLSTALLLSFIRGRR